MPRALQKIACPSASLCVGVPLEIVPSGLLIATDPASGQWTTYALPLTPQSVSCPTTSFCAITPAACGTEKIIASDCHGVRQLDSSTEFEAQTGPQLTALTLTGDTLSWNDHGAATSARLDH